VVDSSRNTDALLKTMRQQMSDDEQQRKLEAQQRQKEREDSAIALSGLSSRVVTLQSWQSDFETQLGNFKGSEEEKHAAAVAALRDIKSSAAALRTENTLLKIGGATVVVAALTYFGGQALGAW
jgi:hypothetical protein